MDKQLSQLEYAEQSFYIFKNKDFVKIESIEI